MKLTIKHKLAVGLAVIAGFLSVSLALFGVFNSTNNKQGLMHVSIRPVDAVPVTVITNLGVMDTFIEPEFDITITSEVEYVQFTSLSHKPTDEIEPIFPSITVTMEKKEALTGEELVVDAISDEKVFKLDSEYGVVDYTEFENGRYVYGTLVTLNRATDGEQILIENTDSGYIIVTAGTDLDPNTMRDAGVSEQTIKNILEASSSD